MSQKPASHFCPNRGVQVPHHVGFAQCIEQHQCFSDDPCPLHQEFMEKSAQSPEHAPVKQQQVSAPQPSVRR